MGKFVRHLAHLSAMGAAVCLLALMLLTFVDVVGRDLFNSALPFAVELTELGMGLLIFLGLALTTLERGHISVDLISTSVPEIGRTLMAFLAAILGTVFFALVAWQLFVRASSFMRDGLATQVLFLPVYPVAFIMALCAVFVTLICIYQIVRPGRGGE